MFVEKTVEEYLKEAASNAEVPGGGSVSALAGALGASMGMMVVNFTIGKKKYADVDAEVKSVAEKIQYNMGVMTSCIDEDAEAFLKFNDVYAMPRDTEEEKAARTEAMQRTLELAMQAPLKAMRAGVECLHQLPRLCEIGNQNLISDSGVAAVMLKACVHAARLNVAINLKYIKNEELAVSASAESRDLVKRADDLARRTLLEVEKQL